MSSLCSKINEETRKNCLYFKHFFNDLQYVIFYVTLFFYVIFYVINLAIKNDASSNIVNLILTKILAFVDYNT